jgi:hypothetical protein
VSQLIRFLVVKLIHTDLNLRFDMSVIFITNYSFPINSETFLMINFVNLKIKPTQSFERVHKDMMCICIHRGECSYIYEYLCL